MGFFFTSNKNIPEKNKVTLKIDATGTNDICDLAGGKCRSEPYNNIGFLDSWQKPYPKTFYANEKWMLDMSVKLIDSGNKITNNRAGSARVALQASALNGHRRRDAELTLSTKKNCRN